VETRQQDNVVFVPRDAVVTFAGVTKVFTVKDGKAQEVVVEVAPATGADVEVTRGLKAGDPVIVKGANRLATGVPVAPNAAPAAPQSTAEGAAPPRPGPRAAADGR